jgi:hypothetical protein
MADAASPRIAKPLVSFVSGSIELSLSCRFPDKRRRLVEAEHAAWLGHAYAKNAIRRAPARLEGVSTASIRDHVIESIMEMIA